MPRGDGTGPMGMGPMTGRAVGYCSGSGAPGFVNAGPGWGGRVGRGFGRGWGRGFAWRAAGGPARFYGAPQAAGPAGPWDARRISREEELQYFYPEMAALVGGCKYDNCRHIREPGCCIREAVRQGKIHESRYRSYTNQYKEIQERRKNQYN